MKAQTKPKISVSKPPKAMASGGEEENRRGEEGEDYSIDEDGGEEEEEAPSHLPFAPTGSELLDVSTTIDPSYIISLIRKILPHDKKIEAKQLPSSAMANGVCPESGDFFFQPFSDEVNQSSPSISNDPWEESGCILWDLSMDRSHAKFMVENFLLEVLLANLSSSTSTRATEICLGIIANLACHDVLCDVIVSTKGLVESVINQLFLEDSACLCEACRLLTVSLQGSACASWAEALNQDNMLQHILWIAENTLNLQLLEKTIELLLTITEHQEVATILIPTLKKLGLPKLLVSLLSCEMDKVTKENKTERLSVLDLILQSIEALSTIDSCSKEISSDHNFFQVLCDTIKAPDKIEIASSCTTAVVIVANILTDEPDLAAPLSQDFPLLQGLLETLPFLSHDLQARNAFWSVMARLLYHVQVKDVGHLVRQKFVSVVLGKLHIIEEDLSGHPLQDNRENLESDSMKAVLFPSLRSVVSLLNRWLEEKLTISEDSQVNHGNEDRKARRLLDLCIKLSS